MAMCRKYHVKWKGRQPRSHGDEDPHMKQKCKLTCAPIDLAAVIFPKHGSLKGLMDFVGEMKQLFVLFSVCPDSCRTPSVQSWTNGDCGTEDNEQ